MKPEVITRCFKRVGMYPDEAIEIEDPFAVEEKLEMEVFAVHDFYLGTRS